MSAMPVFAAGELEGSDVAGWLRARPVKRRL